MLSLWPQTRQQMTVIHGMNRINKDFRTPLILDSISQHMQTCHSSDSLLTEWQKYTFRCRNQWLWMLNLPLLDTTNSII